MSGDKVIEGNIWVRAAGDSAEVGFVPEFLKMFQEEGWNVIPNTGSIKKGQPLMAVETNDSLLSIISPVDGEVQEVAFHAQNSPEKLTAECRVLTIFTGKRVVKKKTSAGASVNAFVFDDFAIGRAQPQMEWANMGAHARRIAEREEARIEEARIAAEADHAARVPAPAPVARDPGRTFAGVRAHGALLRTIRNMNRNDLPRWGRDMLDFYGTEPSPNDPE